MSNLKKYYIYNTLYAVGFMFCSGAIMQTFLLQAGFSEGQVYAFSSFIQFAQVLMMVVMTFLSGKIRKVKLVTGLGDGNNERYGGNCRLHGYAERDLGYFGKYRHAGDPSYR